MHWLFVLSIALAIASALFMLIAGTRPYEKKSFCLVAAVMNLATAISFGTYDLIIIARNSFDALSAAICATTIAWSVLTIDHFREFIKK